MNGRERVAGAGTGKGATVTAAEGAEAAGGCNGMPSESRRRAFGSTPAAASAFKDTKPEGTAKEKGRAEL